MPNFARFVILLSLLVVSVRQATAEMRLASAQLAVGGDKGKYPEFKGNVKTVETRDFWRSTEESPKNQGNHYNQNGETYLNVGQAMGKGMIELLKANK